MSHNSVMEAGKQSFRKRPYQPPGDRAPVSASLRKISGDISRRRFSEGLNVANNLLRDTSLPRHLQGRVMCLVADSEFKRGAFGRAVSIYLEAAKHCLDHHESWLRPLMGSVRALLKDVQTDRAVLMARHAVGVAEQKHAAFEYQVRQANRALASTGRVTVSPLPPPCQRGGDAPGLSVSSGRRTGNSAGIL